MERLTREQLECAANCGGNACITCLMYQPCHKFIGARKGFESVGKTALLLMDERDKLGNTIQGIMHSVDKWFDEVPEDMDEVNRAAKAREIT